MSPKVSDDKALRYYEGVLRSMNEMIGVLRENNSMMKQHVRTVEEVNERVRKIGINTSDFR
jgi:hypothetical protein